MQRGVGGDRCEVGRYARAAAGGGGGGTGDGGGARTSGAVIVIEDDTVHEGRSDENLRAHKRARAALGGASANARAETPAPSRVASLAATGRSTSIEVVEDLTPDQRIQRSLLAAKARGDIIEL